MTVCIALLVDRRATVFGLSDRMITAGDIEYEPAQEKFVVLTPDIVAMTAGDSSFNIEIISELDNVIRATLKSNPDKPLRVAEVAKLYKQILGDLTAQKAAVSLLKPLGLDSETFISRQSELSPSFVEKMATEILNYEVPRVEAIITGIDDKGGHIFVADNEEIQCYDKIGFAAIGAGRWHATSQLMFDCYTSGVDLPGAMFAAYNAKKRAEVAPGVGTATDMFAIVMEEGAKRIRDDILVTLERMYFEMRRVEVDAQVNTKNAWREYFEKGQREFEKENAKLQAKGSGDGLASIDQTDVRDDAGKG